MNEILNHILKKFSSGKFLLAVMLGITFCILALQGKVQSDDFIKAFLVILYAYFTKSKEG